MFIDATGIRLHRKRNHPPADRRLVTPCTRRCASNYRSFSFGPRPEAAIRGIGNARSGVRLVESCILDAPQPKGLGLAEMPGSGPLAWKEHRRA